MEPPDEGSSPEGEASVGSLTRGVLFVGYVSDLLPQQSGDGVLDVSLQDGVLLDDVFQVGRSEPTASSSSSAAATVTRPSLTPTLGNTDAGDI